MKKIIHNFLLSFGSLAVCGGIIGSGFAVENKIFLDKLIGAKVEFIVQKTSINLNDPVDGDGFWSVQKAFDVKTSHIYSNKSKSVKLLTKNNIEINNGWRVKIYDPSIKDGFTSWFLRLTSTTKEPMEFNAKIGFFVGNYKLYETTTYNFNSY